MLASNQSWSVHLIHIVNALTVIASPMSWQASSVNDARPEHARLTNRGQLSRSEALRLKF